MNNKSRKSNLNIFVGVLSLFAGAQSQVFFPLNQVAFAAEPNGTRGYDRWSGNDLTEESEDTMTSPQQFCLLPQQVPGTQVTKTDQENSVTLDYAIADNQKSQDRENLRSQVRAMVDRHNLRTGSRTSMMWGTGGRGMMGMPQATAVFEQTSEGATAIFTPYHQDERDLLSQQLNRHLELNRGFPSGQGGMRHGMGRGMGMGLGMGNGCLSP